jgi:two-component system response regulator NreC
MPVKIILADDHNIMRKGLCSLLEKEPNIEVIAEAENGRETVKLAGELNPDVVIMDISMPDLNGIEATRQIRQVMEDVKIIALSMYSDRKFVTGMLQAGASAYLLKDSAFDELSLAIETVMKGQTYLSPKIAGTVVQDYMSRLTQEEDSVFSSLTDREREVLQLLAEGKSTKEIASDLFVSVKTVETHRQHIMNKLNLRNIPDLVKFAIREGITEL